MRSLVVLPIAVWCLVLTVLIRRLLPARGGVDAWIFGAVVLVAMVMLFVVVPAVILFARPQHLIPPALRGRPGAISEWRRAGGIGAPTGGPP